MSTIISCPDPYEPGGSAALINLRQLGITIAKCPPWCALVPNHSDAVDFPELRHRSNPRLLDPVHGGGDAYRSSRVTLALHIEQYADRSRPPIIVLSTEHHGDDRYVQLTIAEAKTLRNMLDNAITAAKTEPDAN